MTKEDRGVYSCMAQNQVRIGQGFPKKTLYIYLINRPFHFKASLFIKLVEIRVSVFLSNAQFTLKSLYNSQLYLNCIPFLQMSI